ncbi:MAG: HU family DNA-binding protein [Akkermansia sp.]
MNKTQLIARVQRNMGMGSTRDSARAAVDAVLSSIAEASQQERIELRGFGSFFHQKKAARRLLHPSTKEEIILPARSELQFKASSSPSNTKLKNQLES